MSRIYMFFHSLQGNPAKIFFRLGMARNLRLIKRVKKEVRKARRGTQGNPEGLGGNRCSACSKKKPARSAVIRARRCRKSQPIRITTSDAARMSFVNEIAAKTLPAPLLSRALVMKVSFSRIEVAQLSVLLEDKDANWRLASSNLLNPTYLEPDVIQQTVEKLSADPHPEVRQAARALDHAQTLSG